MTLYSGKLLYHMFLIMWFLSNISNEGGTTLESDNSKKDRQNVYVTMWQLPKHKLLLSVFYTNLDIKKYFAS